MLDGSKSAFTESNNAFVSELISRSSIRQDESKLKYSI